ncbi:MAG: hypothetical protein U0792_21330 [Gemmataceae bacterium]
MSFRIRNDGHHQWDFLDGTGRPPVKDAAVVLTNGKIAFAGPLRTLRPLHPGGTHRRSRRHDHARVD